MSEVTMPKAEDKTPCEVCGEMVTTHKGGRASHMRSHKEVKPASPVEAPVAIAADGATEDEKAIIAMAMKAEENFRKAPEVFLSEDTADGNVALVRMYAPDCIDKFNQDGKLVERAKRSPFFSSKENLARWAARGYVPVRGVNGAMVRNDGGDILTSCARDMADARERRTQMDSRDLVHSSSKDFATSDAKADEGATASDLRDTSVKVTQEEIEI
jgi:hypothetical protein